MGWTEMLTEVECVYVIKTSKQINPLGADFPWLEKNDLFNPIRAEFPDNLFNPLGADFPD